MATLEERLRRLEDRAALQDLVVTYFMAVDDDDYARVADCFVADAEFIASGFTGGRGRDPVIAFLKAARATMGQTVHTPNAMLFDLASANDATGIITAHLELGMAATTVYGAVRYHDAYVRTEAGWKIERRQMGVVHMGSWQDANTSLSTQLNIRWPGAEPAPSDYPRAS